MTIGRWLVLFAIVASTDGRNLDDSIKSHEGSKIFKNSTTDRESENFFRNTIEHDNETDIVRKVSPDVGSEKNGILTSGVSKENSTFNFENGGRIFGRDKREKTVVDEISSVKSVNDKTTLNLSVTGAGPQIFNDPVVLSSLKPGVEELKNTTTNEYSIDRASYNEAKRNNESAIFRMLLDEDDESVEEDEERQKKKVKKEDKDKNKDKKEDKDTDKDKVKDRNKDKDEDKNKDKKNIDEEKETTNEKKEEDEKLGNKNEDKEKMQEDIEEKKNKVEEKVEKKKVEEKVEEEEKDESVKSLDSKAESMMKEFKKLPENHRKTFALSFDRFIAKALSKDSNNNEEDDEDYDVPRHRCCSKCCCGRRGKHENSSKKKITSFDDDTDDYDPNIVRRTLPQSKEIEFPRYANVSDRPVTVAPSAEASSTAKTIKAPPTKASETTKTTTAPSTEASGTAETTAAPHTVASGITRTMPSREMVRTPRRKNRKEGQNLRHRIMTTETPTVRKKCNKRRKEDKKEKTTVNPVQSENPDGEQHRPHHRRNFDDPEDDLNDLTKKPKDYKIDASTKVSSRNKISSLYDNSANDDN